MHNLSGISWRPGRPPGESTKLAAGIVPDLEVEGRIARAVAHSEQVGCAGQECDP